MPLKSTLKRNSKPVPKDYHKILGVDYTADKDEIKKAYRVLAKKYHPDMNPSPGADEIFMEITEAYDMLSSRPEGQNMSPPDMHQQEKEDIRRRAAEHARMKYQKFARQHEAFQASGFYDISLLFKFIGRVIFLMITLFFWFFPILISFFEWRFIFLGAITWPVALFFTKYIREHGRRYFRTGKFYYTFSRLKDHLTTQTPDPQYKCFYCKGKMADSKPYKIYLLKVKDAKVNNQGPFLHQVQYRRTYKTIKIPRSQKALVNHSVASAIKVLCVFVLPFFLPFSIHWRLAIGIYCGLALSALFGWLARTKSKTAYLFNRSILYKIIIWNLVLFGFTNYNLGWHSLRTYDAINAVIFILIMFDPLYEQIAKSKKGKGHYRLRPFSDDYREMDKYFDHRYQYQIDVPVWTVVYPLIKWVFG
jgi:hypothetical protein